MAKEKWCDLNLKANSAADAVERANAAYDSLVNKKAEADRRISELAQARKKLAFSALGEEDVNAQKKLAQLNQESTVAGLEAENILHAQEEARTLLKDAEAAHAKAVQKLAARETQAKLVDLEKQATELDGLLKSFVALFPPFQTLATNILSAAGRDRLSAASAVRVFSRRAVISAFLPVEHALGLDWSLVPRDRTSLQKAVKGWAPAVDAACERKLEE